jgi:hypothetical protein
MRPAYITYIFTRLFSPREKIFALQKRPKIYVNVCGTHTFTYIFQDGCNMIYNHFPKPNKKCASKDICECEHACSCDKLEKVKVIS